jgi:hypothetical protein
MWLCVCNVSQDSQFEDNHRLSSELASKEMLDISTAPLQQLWSDLCNPSLSSFLQHHLYMILPNPFTNSKNAILCQCFRRQSIWDASKTLQELHRRRSCNLSTHDCQDTSSAYSQRSSFSTFEHCKVGTQKTSVVVTISSATWLNLFSWIKLTPILYLPVQLSNTLESNAWYHCTNSHKQAPHVMFHIHM